MKINCLIIDDEQLARDMLESYALQIPAIKVVGKCKNAKETITALHQQKIHLLLLDIQMPKMTGIELLRKLPNPPKVIFTTAYSNYAMAGYEFDVIDYLLKPIGFERFQKAITKALKQLNIKLKAAAFEQSQAFQQAFIIVKEGYNHQKLFLKDITYVEAMREYVVYHTNHGRLMELKSLTVLERSLPPAHFLRIHRSYMIAKTAVARHQHNKLILADGTLLPLGKTYKQLVLKELF